MTYKVSIGKIDYTCSYANREMFEYAGLFLKDLKGQLAVLAFPEIAAAMVIIHDPRYAREFYYKEGDGDLEDAKKFITWLFQAASKEPGDVFNVRFIKEKGFDNPEGV